MLMICMMISTAIPSTTLGWFIIAFIVISLDEISCLSTTYVEEGTGSQLPCKHDVPDNEIRRVRWFKSNQDLALVSWDGASQPYTSDNYDIDKNFSLVINNTSIREEGKYRCYVTRNIPGDFVYYEVEIIVYGKAKPAHTSPVQNGTHLKIPCSSNSTSASKVAVLWYKRNSTGILNSDEELIVSVIHGRRLDLTEYTVNVDFSLEIQNVSIEYEAVYRSVVVSTQETRPSASDTNVTVYVLPRKKPFIQHSFQGNTSFINCSVDHVHPLLFPKLNCLSNPQTYTVRNTDGTFNTSISGNVTHHDNDTIECTFPHFNYTEKSSLRIPVNISDEEEGPPPADCAASVCSNHAGSTIGVVLGTLILITFVILLVVFLWKRRLKKHQQNDVDKSLPEIEPMV